MVFPQLVYAPAHRAYPDAAHGHCRQHGIRQDSCTLHQVTLSPEMTSSTYKLLQEPLFTSIEEVDALFKLIDAMKWQLS